MPKLTRIEISPTQADDAVSARALNKLKQICESVEQVRVVRVITIKKNFETAELNKIADQIHNPIIETYLVDEPTNVLEFDFVIEVGFLPGVTDNVAHTTKEIISDLHKTTFADEEAVASSKMYLIKGALSEDDLIKIKYNLHNDLIEKAVVMKANEYIDQDGIKAYVPTVKLERHEVLVSEVDLNVSDEALEELGKKGIKNEDGTFRGPLALSLNELHTIQAYFKNEGRNPTDIELEAIAQTWSEHCKHKIFASPIDEIEGGLYRDYIKQATKDVRAAKGADDFCVSVFKDNSGAIKFNDDYYVTDKAETHNTPSALDPFGGSITGIVGVNRDTLGFGKGARPVVNRYGFCLADPRDASPLYRDSQRKVKMLPPKRILEGVVKGVEAGGNESGIPGPQGFLYYNERYKGKPLVFVGTVGLIPKEVDGKPSTEKKAGNNDLIVVIGGRVGQDGIHGATFSSESLDEGSPSTAVQIGDAITQKRFMDAVLMEARDLGLYNSITDNGAGGISCSVAEMAEECGGCQVDLEKVPLKYANLEPWKIWISESQERMTLSVPEANWDKFKEIMDKHGVEATVIGRFNDSSRCQVSFEGKLIFDLEMDFLHDGAPLPKLETVYEKPQVSEPELSGADLETDFVNMMQRLNVASFANISTRFDHEVQGSSIIKPLQGKGKVNGTATVYRPDLNSWSGVVLSQGINPLYSDIDTYHMAASAIDTAIRNAVSAGANVDHMALMDNFCWCSSNEAQRLGELKAAVKACYDYAVAYGTPYISGKDSMFNDFKGFDADGNPIKISVPPTLLVSSLSVIDDVRKAITLDPKVAGDLIYVIGETKNELGGSEYYAMHGETGSNIPQVNAEAALELYRDFYKAVKSELIVSAVSVGLGGLAVSFTKMLLAGQLGLDLDLTKLNSDLAANQVLFSESQSRFVVTVNPELQSQFEQAFANHKTTLIGNITAEADLKIKTTEADLQLNPEKLNQAYYFPNQFY